MLARFSAYGFLKNQRYFEPFLVLAFLDKGLSFFAVGALIAVREIATNLLEIPSGAVADLLGRRRSMIVSFVAYVASFLVFGLTADAWWLFPAMLLFSVGDAFRTGTHKAMIFAWLRGQGREDEKTRIYGYTRSWSKLGSAMSVVVGAVFVFATDDYSAVFLLSAVPSALNIVNFLGYPRELDGTRDGPVRVVDVWRHTRDAVRNAFARPRLRQLVVESMAFEGLFHAAKDYLQPLLAAAATAWFARALAEDGMTDVQRSTLLIGPVYFVLYLVSSQASRNAHRVVERAGSESRAALGVWLAAAVLFAGILTGELAGAIAVSVTAFVLLHVIQNVWRPILVSRFDACGDAEHGATTLSIESQARRVVTMALAPVLGLAIDRSTAAEPAGAFWPIGALGLAVALAMFAYSRRGAALAA